MAQNAPPIDGVLQVEMYGTWYNTCTQSNVEWQDRM